MSGISVLLVDDDESVCDGLSRILSIKGYEVRATSSAKEALKALTESRFNILLTDLKMPEMNGITLLKEARKIAPNIGVIIMTGYGEVTSYIEAMDFGADEYMNKPIKSEELDIIIKKLAKRKKIISNTA